MDAQAERSTLSDAPGPGPQATICGYDLLGQASVDTCTCTGTIFYGSNQSFLTLTVFAASIPCSATASTSSRPPWDRDPSPLQNKTCYCDPAPYQSVAFPVLCTVHAAFATGMTAAHALKYMCSCGHRDLRAVLALAGHVFLFGSWVTAIVAFLLAEPDVAGCWLFRQTGNPSDTNSIDFGNVRAALDASRDSWLFSLSMLLWWLVVLFHCVSMHGHVNSAAKGGLMVLTAFMNGNIFPITRFKWFVNPSCPPPALPSFIQTGMLSWFGWLGPQYPLLVLGLLYGLICLGCCHPCLAFGYAIGSFLVIAFVVIGCWVCDQLQAGFEIYQASQVLQGDLKLPVSVWISCALALSVGAWCELVGACGAAMLDLHDDARSPTIELPSL